MATNYSRLIAPAKNRVDARAETARQAVYAALEAHGLAPEHVAELADVAHDAIRDRLAMEESETVGMAR